MAQLHSDSFDVIGEGRNPTGRRDLSEALKKLREAVDTHALPAPKA
jgi:hypothetical protein